MLRPKANAFRGMQNLDGLWSFQLDTEAEAEDGKPWTRTLPTTLQIPVPSSYNDVLAHETVGNHIGWVYYQRLVSVPFGWQQTQKSNRILLRFEAVTHHARVYINDELVAEHSGGYTPFDIDITRLLKTANNIGSSDGFRLTVAVGNELDWHTIPPGRIEVDERGKKRQFYQHDFFNHSGIARSVWLYCVPAVHIRDVSVNSIIDHERNRATVEYHVDVGGVSGTGEENSSVQVALSDEGGRCVASCQGEKGSLQLETPDLHLWQPGAAYLYTFTTSLLLPDHPIAGQNACSPSPVAVDIYTLPIGLRSISISSSSQFLINNTPFYFTGFGKHEDSPSPRGKAHDPVQMVHDFSLLSWIGANSIRTAHYPHSEDVLEYADRHGLVIIDETPAVGLNLGIIAGVTGKPAQPTFSPETHDARTQAAHADAIRALVGRDKNYACVVMWCLANEPASSEPGAREYFSPLVQLARDLDPQARPLCYTNEKQASADGDRLADMFDVLCLNRYYGWYLHTGDLDAAESGLEEELREWVAKYPGKPILMSEYGADTLAGLHAPAGRGGSLPWSEEYQTAVLNMSHAVFDRVGAVAGEHVWSFADFQTPAGFIFRVDGNRKGAFTRDRRPKGTVEALKRRWVGMREKGRETERRNGEREGGECM